MDELTNLFIRHPRSGYTMEHLGPQTLPMFVTAHSIAESEAVSGAVSPMSGSFAVPHFDRRVIKRTDFDVVNDRKNKLKCSLWSEIELRPSSATVNIAGANVAALNSNYRPPIMFDHRSSDAPPSTATTDPTLSPAATTLPTLASPSASRLRTTCMIYSHGSSGGRYDAVIDGCVEIGLHYGFGGCVGFDFSGCGMSDGDYMSLGFREQIDLRHVIEHLMDSQKMQAIGFTQPFDRFVLWGRSMGAVTAVLYASTVATELAAAGINPMPSAAAAIISSSAGASFARQKHPLIIGLILDSPYSSLWTLAESIVENYKIRLPKVVLTGVAAVGLSIVRSALLNKIPGFDIKEMEILKPGSLSASPAFFLHGSEDDFVLPSQSKALYNVYGTALPKVTESKGSAASGPPNTTASVYSSAPTVTAAYSSSTGVQISRSTASTSITVMKRCLLTKGGHNTTRPITALNHICEFLHEFMLDEQDRSISSLLLLLHSLPSWRCRSMFDVFDVELFRSGPLRAMPMDTQAISYFWCRRFILNKNDPALKDAKDGKSGAGPSPPPSPPINTASNPATNTASKTAAGTAALTNPAPTNSTTSTATATTADTFQSVPSATGPALASTTATTVSQPTAPSTPAPMVMDMSAFSGSATSAKSTAAEQQQISHATQYTIIEPPYPVTSPVESMAMGGYGRPNGVFDRNVVLALHKTNGLFEIQPFTGRVLAHYAYTDLGRLGSLTAANVVYFSLSATASANETEASSSSLPDVMSFWCDRSIELSKQFEYNVDLLIKSQGVDKILANVEHAASVLIDSYREKKQKVNAVRLIENLVNTVMSVLPSTASAPQRTTADGVARGRSGGNGAVDRTFVTDRVTATVVAVIKAKTSVEPNLEADRKEYAAEEAAKPSGDASAVSNRKKKSDCIIS